MSVLGRFRRRRPPYRAVTDEERIARYVYLLSTLPASVIESAHAKAFEDVPLERRREMFAQLRPFMSEGERDAASDDPTVLARLLRRAEEHRAKRAAAGGGADGAPAEGLATRISDDPRDGVDPRAMMMNAGVMAVVANQFLLSSSVSAYFLYGAGSLQLADQPAWVGETFDPGASGVDGALGGDFGGGFDGAGFDGGGFGGFDGGFG